MSEVCFGFVAGIISNGVSLIKWLFQGFTQGSLHAHIMYLPTKTLFLPQVVSKIPPVTTMVLKQI